MQAKTAGLMSGRRSFLDCALLFCLLAMTSSGSYSRSQSRPSSAMKRGHTAPVFAVAFSPNGQRLASAGADKSVILWDVGTGRELRTMAGHTAMITDLAFSPDGRLLVSSSIDHTIRVWDPATGKPVQVLPGQQNVVPLALSPDGRLLASACAFRMADGGCDDPSIKLWNFREGVAAGILSGHKTGVRALAFSPDARSLASGGEDRTVRLWDVRSRTELWSIAVPLGAYALAFSADGKLLAAQENKIIHVLDAATGQELHSLKQPFGGQGVAFSPNGRWFASTGADPYLTLWDVRTWSPVRRLSSEGLNCRGTAFSPDSRLLAAACSDNTVRVFTGENVQPVRTLGHAASYSD